MGDVSFQGGIPVTCLCQFGGGGGFFPDPKILKLSFGVLQSILKSRSTIINFTGVWQISGCLYHLKKSGITQPFQFKSNFSTVKAVTLIER